MVNVLQLLGEAVAAAATTTTDLWSSNLQAATLVLPVSIDSSVRHFLSIFYSRPDHFECPSIKIIITQLLESVRSPKLEKNDGRKSAVFVNATIVSHFRQARDTFGNAQVTSSHSPFLMVHMC
jgi:hypothetical protein